jgi:hypothetical protein
MPAARSIAQLLEPGVVWCVCDQWRRVVDSGRSPGTRTCAPTIGEELDAAPLARWSSERHRDELDGLTIAFWRFTDEAATQLPRDRTARMVASDMAADLGLGAAGEQALAARVEGIAGWANEQVGTASLDGMRGVLDARARAVPELAELADHPEFGELIGAKARELVARRLAR